jgi:flagellar hook-associated protein 1 FlgK
MSVTAMVWENSQAQVELTDGELAGLVEIRDEKIVAYLEQLDTLALAIVSEVNAIHRDGYGLDGSTGVDFFDRSTSGARDMALSTIVQADVNAIAASQDGSSGDNSNALTIADLRTRRTMDGAHLSFGEYYASLVQVIGSESQEAAFMEESYDMLVQRLENERLSISGVSLDEETSLLIQYQRSYEAAARVITAADELMQTILNMV